MTKDEAATVLGVLATAYDREIDGEQAQIWYMGCLREMPLEDAEVVVTEIVQDPERTRGFPNTNEVFARWKKLKAQRRKAQREAEERQLEEDRGPVLDEAGQREQIAVARSQVHDARDQAQIERALDPELVARAERQAALADEAGVSRDAFTREVLARRDAAAAGEVPPERAPGWCERCRIYDCPTPHADPALVAGAGERAEARRRRSG